MLDRASVVARAKEIMGFDAVVDDGLLAWLLRPPPMRDG
jgi:hypothetical protein